VPLVNVLLTPGSTELSEKCSAAAKLVLTQKDWRSVSKFFREYGTFHLQSITQVNLPSLGDFFVQEVMLGGRWLRFEEISTTGTATKDSMQTAMGSEFQAMISVPLIVDAKVGFKQDQQTVTGGASASSGTTTFKNWSTVGGHHASTSQYVLIFPWHRVFADD